MELKVGDSAYVLSSLGAVKRVTIVRIDNYFGKDWYDCDGWVCKIYLKDQLFATKKDLLDDIANQLEKLP